MKNGYIKYRHTIDKIISHYSEKNAVRYMRNNGSIDTLTFAQLGKFFRDVENKMSLMRLGAGDRAVILAPLSPAGVFTGIALTYCNVTVVPVDSSLPVEEIKKLIEFSDVKALFTTDSIYEILGKNITENIPCYRLGDTLEIVPFTDFPETTKENPDPDPELIAIIYSSGTTGQMKGIEVPYISTLKSRLVTLRLSGIKGYMSYLLMLPFNHIAGFTSVTTCFLSGCEIDFIEDADATKLQKAFLTFQPSFYIMIPKVYEIMEQKIKSAVHEKGKIIETAFNGMLKLSGFSRKYLGINFGRKLFMFIRKEAMGKNIFGFATGASPCRPETAEFYLSLGIEFENFYASTETNVTLTATGVLDRWSPDSVGNVNHHPEIKVRIRQPDKNGTGEIMVKTELIMKGYFRQPELTASVFEDGWFRTGDYGYIDEKGYLYVTGRIKESIILQNGKKVSPADVDNYYIKRLPEYDMASRGIQADGNSYDEIHLFVSVEKLNDKDFSVIYNEIMKVSRNAPEMYRISEIHFIPEIKRTAVGKVKRFRLNPDESININEKILLPENISGNDIINTVIECIKRLEMPDDDFVISPEMRLNEDIGMESLNIFEMCTELDGIYNVSVEEYLFDEITVSDIAEIIKYGKCRNMPEENLDRYPLEKTRRDLQKFEAFTKLSRKIYNFKIYGKNNIKKGEKYIFCPNHECHFDGMWVIGCLDRETKKNICSVAADYLFKEKIYNFGVKVMGGIPIHRNGNSAPAMKRALKCLKTGKHSLLIHPEGTRTSDGKLGVFKKGAAKLAIKSGVKIIPVCIDGAYEIFPRFKDYPKLFDFDNMKRLPVSIRFGKPISPANKTENELTSEIQQQIYLMKKYLR
ncbi:MAG: AMP-binding protein [Muribaculaceae bacterium]|nr:AMP-binding protein [Alistipes senegalensis]MCM1473718.1 AMP-binding protein [Muribaculaceae bacterium]